MSSEQQTVDFYWVLMFARTKIVEVSDDAGSSYPVGTVEMFTRDGVAEVLPGDTRQMAVANLVNHCKSEMGVPRDALLTGYVLEPNTLI